ncbi:MAG: SHOCT domain-containing protein [Solirubrobacterales bacterium]|nr:SHOCT domain-containing protein [Solirubrobacterales bacterium]MCB8969650.1 SHOCT domain-containing protein [Thermoleophilales bacterium]
MLLAEYTFGQGLLTVLWIFVFVAWIMVLFTIIGDLFRDHELSGWGKAVWIFFLVFLPFLTGLIYLIARGNGMRERSLAAQKEAQQQMDAYIRETAGGSSDVDEIAKLADLHEKGKLTDQEFADAKAKLLG